MKSDEFFIGYAPPMPPRLARFVARTVVGLACGAVTWAATLAAGHVPLDGGTFEFGHPQRFTGTVIERPYPALRPDGVPGTDARWLLLVAPGKHGADAIVNGLDRRLVTMMGTPIRRGAQTMIEIEPNTIVSLEGPKASKPAETIPADDLSGDRSVEVRGEIVDSKCFLGVMVPGSGKTHKDCAALCLRGGVPPALHVQDRSGHSAVLLLTGSAGDAIGAEYLQHAGEAIDMTGVVRRQGGWLMLRSDPRFWRPVAR
jgi:hypothetical protein